MIADLNPSIDLPEDTRQFAQALKGVENMTPALYSDAREFGDKYFWIPALDRHRGSCHVFVGRLDSDESSHEDAIALAVDLVSRTKEKKEEEITQELFPTFSECKPL